MDKEEIMKEIEHIANCELYDTIGVKYLRLNIEKLFEENKQLKERIDKAIEYINKCISSPDIYERFISNGETKQLLDILKEALKMRK